MHAASVAVPALVVLTIVSLAGRLEAQGDRWTRQVEARLDRAGRAIAEQGYRRVGGDRGELGTGESRVTTARLDAGHEYVLLGSCDDDCGALDLAVANETGYDLDADRGRSNAPLVRIRPSRTGEYRIKVTMAACRVSPCRYGVGVFRD